MKTDAEYADLCQRLQRRVDNWRNGRSACRGDPMPLRIRETQEASVGSSKNAGRVSGPLYESRSIPTAI
jgi:hypothetical protein